MKVSAIIQLVNAKLADEIIRESELLNYIDAVIDDINTRLDSIFPTVSDLINASGEADVDYNVFPDKYIRSVVVVGTAYKFYTTDEEGNMTAVQYGRDYTQALYYMERDYTFSVPELYRAENQGILDNDEKDTGIWLLSGSVLD